MFHRGIYSDFRIFIGWPIKNRAFCNFKFEVKLHFRRQNVDFLLNSFLITTKIRFHIFKKRIRQKANIIFVQIIKTFVPPIFLYLPVKQLSIDWLCLPTKSNMLSSSCRPRPICIKDMKCPVDLAISNICMVWCWTERIAKIRSTM